MILFSNLLQIRLIQSQNVFEVIAKTIFFRFIFVLTNILANLRRLCNDVWSKNIFETAEMCFAKLNNTIKDWRSKKNEE